MKKIVSFLLVTVMVFSIALDSFAMERIMTTPVLIDEYAGNTGVFYAYSLPYCGEEWNAIVFVSDEAEKAKLTATSINSKGDEIYELSLIYSAAKTPVDYLRDGFSELKDANIIHVSDVVTINNSNIASGSMQRGEIENAIENLLIDTYGNKYSRVVYTNSTYAGVSSIKVHEDLVFRYNKKGTLTFAASTALSLAALALTKYLGYSVTASVLALVVSVSGEIISAYSEVDTYIVKADFGRWTTINNSSYVYTITNKIYTHYALNEKNNTKPLYFKEGNPQITYSPSASYYNSYVSQTNDAYAIYQEMN